jgi:hypothetical protein
MFRDRSDDDTWRDVQEHSASLCYSLSPPRRGQRMMTGILVSIERSKSKFSQRSKTGPSDWIIPMSVYICERYYN